MLKTLLSVLFGFCIVLLAHVVGGYHDAYAEEDEDTPVLGDLSNIFDFKTLGGMDARLSPHGNDLMGDMIDKNKGGITFVHMDISIPGNSGLEVALRRKISQGPVSYSPYQHGFGDWVIDLPIAHVTYAPGANSSPQPVFNSGCLNNLGSMDANIAVTEPTSSISIMVEPDLHLSGAILNVPGKGLSGYAGDVKNPADPKSDWMSGPRTTDFAGRCATVTVAPDGTLYKFGKHVIRSAQPLPVPISNIPCGTVCGTQTTELSLFRKSAVYLVTEVEDVHGNWVRYDYTNDARAELTRIYSNDGREINLSYDTSAPHFSRNSRRVTSITANGRMWTYEYDFTGNNAIPYLEKVTLPDDRYWKFGDGSGLRPMQFQVHAYYKCIPFDELFELKHPDGAVGTFRIRETRHIKNASTTGYLGDDEFFMQSMNIPHVTNNDHCNGTPNSNGGQPNSENTWDRPHGWPVYRVMSVASKTLSGPNLSEAIWEFEYRNYDGGDIDNNWTTITSPDGTERTYTHRAIGPDQGLLKSIDVVPTSGAGETINYEHRTDGDGAPGGNYGLCRANGYERSGRATPDACQTYKKRPVSKIIRERDGDTYSTEYVYSFGSTISEYASKPISVRKYSSVSTTPRTTDKTYIHDTLNWILGLTDTVTVNGVEHVDYDYGTSGGALGQVVSQKSFGHTVATFGYNADGTTAWYEDALLRRTEALNWKLGTPQRIKRPDNTSIYQYVDDNGWIERTRDARNNWTTYEQDSMGRLTKITPPQDDRTWTHTDIAYNFTGGGAVQTVTKGDAITTITYDGLLRPILEKTRADDTGWESYTRTEYDPNGQVSFKSFPSFTPNPTNGMTTEYDALGRVVETQETVAPFATTTTAYLDSHRTQVTDPDGFVTTTYKDGFGGPGGGDVIKIEQPEGVTTEINRDTQGLISSVRQTGPLGETEIQRYFYDTRQRLCRYFAVEARSTTYEYDDAGQMIAYAKGQPNSGCTVPNDTTRIDLTYDLQGRLDITDFADPNTPDIDRNYDNDGNLIRLIRGDTDWSYSYDDMGNLLHEQLRIFIPGPDRYMRLDYAWNDDGYLEQTTYPTGTVVNHELDGLGRDSRVYVGPTDYALNIDWHSNGALDSLTHANGVVTTNYLNNRQQISRIRSYKPGGQTMQNMYYTYDARGLVTDIIDGWQTNHRTYGYDGLGRLTTASGPWDAATGGGNVTVTGSFTYDGLGNITAKTLGNRTVGMTYHATNNRMMTVTDSGATGTRTLNYDLRGNVTRIGTQSFVYDYSDQPVSLSGDVTGSYVYDGHKRRVVAETTKAGVTTTLYNMFDAAGRLKVVEERHTDGSYDTTEYIHGAGRMLARVKTEYDSSGAVTNTDTTYHHPDILGTDRSASNAAGSRLWLRRHTPFGIRIDNHSDYDDQAGFTGHIEDSSTGLTYMQARYYDPVASRFLSVDPVDFIRSGMNPSMFNRYSYSYNDPTNHVDPDGEWAWLGRGLLGAYIGGTSGASAGFVTSGNSRGARVGAIAGGASGFVAGAFSANAPTTAFAGSVTAQIATQIDSNLSNEGVPATANLQIDVPVTAGSVVGSASASPLVNAITSKTKVRGSGVIGKVAGDPAAGTAKPGAFGNTMGALADGSGAGIGELGGAFIGNVLEANDVPTAIQLTNEHGQFELDFTSTNRLCRDDDPC